MSIHYYSKTDNNLYIERNTIKMNISKFYTPSAELYQRIHNFQQKLEENSIHGAIILQKADLFYFTGTIQQAHLFIPESGEPVLMVFKDLERAKKESSLNRIVYLSSPKKIPAILKENGYEIPIALGMELDVLPVNLFFRYSDIFNSSKIIDISHQVRLVRAIKSDYEINLIRKAAKFSDKIVITAGNLIKEGITEVELAGQIEAVARSFGHQGIIRMRLWGNELFYGHLMCGASATTQSYISSPTGGEGVNPSVAQGAGFNTIKRNEPLLFDFAFAYNGYISDHTRIFAIGNLSDKLYHAHNAMLDIHDLLKREAKPDVPAGNLYDLALEQAKQSGYENNFMGAGDKRIHFVGHGVGLELDEYPFLAKGQKLKLQEKMVIAIEPKLIFPDKGVVGIENTCIVTKSGLEPLSKIDGEVIVV